MSYNSWCARVKRQRQPDEARKGHGSLQELPASCDAFVWLRLHPGRGGWEPAPNRPCQPLWLTLRRPLSYHAAHHMFERPTAGASAGGDELIRVWTGQLQQGRADDPRSCASSSMSSAG